MPCQQFPRAGHGRHLQADVVQFSAGPRLQAAAHANTRPGCLCDSILQILAKGGR